MTSTRWPAIFGRLATEMDTDRDSEAGNAIIEFIFIALFVMVPLIYLIVAFAVVQRNQFAVTNAAREVGRAIATAPSSDPVAPRAAAALRIALAGQHLDSSDVQVRYIAAGGDCIKDPAITPSRQPGSEFAVCVIRRTNLPAVPTIVSGRGIRLIGEFTVHLDDYRRTGP